MNTSIKLNTPCEIINVTPLNPLISKCQIKVCYVGDEPNRNKSIITKQVAIDMANSLPGSPIVGFYNEANSDFEEHNKVIKISNGRLKIEDTTRPYGFVDLNAKVWFQDYLDGDVVHTYLVTEGYLWTGQYPEAKRIIERGNNQSMELDKKSLDGSWTYDYNSGMEFFIINDAIFSKLCILGDDMEPCFEGAQITSFSLDDDFNNKIYALMKEVKMLKGGNPTVEKDMKKPEEETVDFAMERDAEGEAAEVENPAEESPEVEETTAEQEEVSTAAESEEEEVAAEAEPAEELEEEAPEAEAEEVEEEVLEEEPAEEEQEENLENEGEDLQFSLADFQDLQESYSNLETKFNELQTEFSNLKTSYDALVEFKNTKDREEKQAMIDSFYMLGDEDKKDVQDNIDSYSLDEIEAKLSIICVHNKLDMSGKADNEKDTSTTFNLDEVDDDSEDANIPALVSVLRKNRNNVN